MKILILLSFLQIAAYGHSIPQNLDMPDLKVCVSYHHEVVIAGLNHDERLRALVNGIDTQKKRSVLTEIKKHISTDSEFNIHALYEGLIKDSIHFYFDVAEINDYAFSLLDTKLTTAIQLLNESNRFFANNSETTMLLGEAYEKAGDKYMARQLYEETLALKPDPTTTYILLKRVRSLYQAD